MSNVSLALLEIQLDIIRSTHSHNFLQAQPLFSPIFNLVRTYTRDQDLNLGGKVPRMDRFR